MKLRSHIKQAFRKLSEIKKGSLHLLLLSSFFIPILLILFLDFFNIEAIAPFNQIFMFDLTWKGRMFYLFFMWLLLLESILDWEVIIEKQRAFRHRILSLSSALNILRKIIIRIFRKCTLPRLSSMLNILKKSVIKKQRAFQNLFRVLLLCVFVAVPIIYVLGVNFGQALQIRPGWALPVEYLILASFFIFATWLAYGLAGLKSFSISLSLLAGIGVIYLVDTIWPYGTFEPMQLLTVPTAACAAALLDLLGYKVTLTYPVFSPEHGSMPLMIVREGGKTVSAAIAWPCAGVHSLLLFTLITLVFFKKTTIQRERKIVFFLIGAAGTYLTNIFRIASYFTISIRYYGSDAGWVFHNTYGELYFIAWMLIYFIIVIAIQSGKINKFAQAFRKRLKVFNIRSRR